MNSMGERLRMNELDFKPPPVLVNERVVWLGSGSGLPLSATVRWIGKLVEMGPDWIVGLELDKPMPYGGIDGYWGKRKLFSCEPKHGLLVPVDKIMKESILLKQRNSFDEQASKSRNAVLLRQLSSPVSKNKEEFITKVLPQPRSNPSTTQAHAFSTSSQSSAGSSDARLAPLSVENVKTHELTAGQQDELKLKKYQESLKNRSLKTIEEIEQHHENLLLSRRAYECIMYDEGGKSRRNGTNKEGKITRDVAVQRTQENVRPKRNHEEQRNNKSKEKYVGRRDGEKQKKCEDVLRKSEKREIVRGQKEISLDRIQEDIKLCRQKEDKRAEFQQWGEDSSARRQTVSGRTSEERPTQPIDKGKMKEVVAEQTNENKMSGRSKEKLRQDDRDIRRHMEKVKKKEDSAAEQTREDKVLTRSRETLRQDDRSFQRTLEKDKKREDMIEQTNDDKRVTRRSKYKQDKFVEHVYEELSTVQRNKDKLAGERSTMWPSDEKSRQVEKNVLKSILKISKSEIPSLTYNNVDEMRPDLPVKKHKKLKELSNGLENVRSLEADVIETKKEQTFSLERKKCLKNKKDSSTETDFVDLKRKQKTIDKGVGTTGVGVKETVIENYEPEATKITEESDSLEVQIQKELQNLSDILKMCSEEEKEKVDEDTGGSEDWDLVSGNKTGCEDSSTDLLGLSGEDQSLENIVNPSRETDIIANDEESLGQNMVVQLIQEVASVKNVDAENVTIAGTPTNEEMKSAGVETIVTISHDANTEGEALEGNSERSQETDEAKLMESDKEMVNEVAVEDNLLPVQVVVEIEAPVSVDRLEILEDEDDVDETIEIQTSEEFENLVESGEIRDQTPTPSLRKRKQTQRLSTIEEERLRLDARCRVRDDIGDEDDGEVEEGGGDISNMSQDTLKPASPTQVDKPGFFSFLRWFKRSSKQQNDKVEINIDDFKCASSVPASPLLLRGRESSCNSIDTLFSIATVSSFAFVSPAQYPLNRDQQIAGRETLERKKKRRAPEPPAAAPAPPVNSSLPNTLENRREESRVTRHRRTVSETGGVYSHVRGKKRAPAPPASSLYPNLDQVKNLYPSTGRRKRQAPQPPTPAAPSEGRLSTIERDRIITDIDRIQELTRNTVDEMGQQTTIELQQDSTSVCNDTLRLERGMLQPNKPNLTGINILPSVQVTTPVSPKPWYKRSRDIGLFKSSDKNKKDQGEAGDWMPEIGYSRPTSAASDKFNIFSRLDRDKDKSEKRKSQVAMLANISELDREAAEIVKKEKEGNTEQIMLENERYYSYPEVPFILTSMSDTIQQNDLQEQPKRNSTRELISLFNSISSVGLFSDKKASPPSQRKMFSSFGMPGEKVEIKQANVVETRKYEQAEERDKMSTITEQSESAPSTINNYDENKPKMWTCPRCTLENPKWKIICDACSCRKSDQRKSEMDIDIDWEKELKKYFPNKSEKRNEEEKLEQVRRARLAYFNKENHVDSSTNTNQLEVGGARKKIIDETEKIKLKEMLKNMKNSLPKTDNCVINSKKDVNNEKTDFVNSLACDTGSFNNNTSTRVECSDAVKYGAIKKQKKSEVAEAVVITTTTVYEDVLVKKERNKQHVIPVTVQHFSTTDNGRVRRKPSYELIRAKDLVDIVAMKSGRVFPATCLYENTPNTVFSKNNSGCLNLSLAQPDRTDDDDDDGADDVEKEFDDLFRREFETSRSPSVSSDSSEVEKLTQKLTQAQGLADFKADVKSDCKLNTLAVNRLLKRLEVAIADGQHLKAAGLARELAKMKISCSVVRHRCVSDTKPLILVNLYVEDKVSHQGPIPLQLSPVITLAELKVKVEKELEIPAKVQRWILGKSLATDDLQTLEDHGITSSGSTIFLYLVAPETEVEREETTAADDGSKAGGEEMQLDEAAGVTNGVNKQVLGKGWYYNFEEDRYSYCESDESGEDEKMEKAVRVIQKTIETAKTRTNNVKKVSKPRSIFDLLKPDMRESIKKDLKVITVNSVRETIEKLNSNHISATKVDRLEEHGTLALGWKCSVCTLVNPPTRPGCSACTTERPVNYVVPTSYRANELELSRIRREQLVETELKKHAGETGGVGRGGAVVEPGAGHEHYLELVNLDNADLVVNTTDFDCSVCLVKYGAGEGVVLRECLHTFCRQCLVNTVEFTDEAEVKCPYRDENYSCESVLQEREIKSLVPKRVYEQHLAKSVAEAENKINNAFHCKTPDCHGWCILEDNVNQFHCPVCKRTNCLTCQAIHDNVNCKQYQEHVRVASETNVEARRTREMLEEMVDRGEAMACPTCQVVLMKKWGCDWLRCSMCKTEICWVTRKPRWGPGGKGDTSGGCQCGLNGVKCHPKCNYCH